MLKHLKFTLRIFVKSRLIIVTNTIGMSIGFAVCILLWLYVSYETSYDKHFENSDRIVRLNTTWIEGNNNEFLPISLRKAHTELAPQFPEIEASVQVFQMWTSQIKIETLLFAGNKMLYADSTFFKVFKIPFVYGSPQNALLNSKSVVIAESLSQKVFGNINPIGKIIVIDTKVLTISGVTKDLPATSHFTYQVILPMQAYDNLMYLGGLEFFTYFLLAPNTNINAFYNKFNSKHKELLQDRFSDFNATFDSFIEPLLDLHLYTKSDFDLSPKGDVKKNILVAVIALIILLMATVNCINLFIVMGQNRIKELGMRKVIGASISSLKKQLLYESLLQNLIAIIVSVGLLTVILPIFNSFVQRPLLISSIFTLSGFFTLLSFWIVTSIMSGAYPAYVLSKSTAIDVLKNNNANTNSKRMLTPSIVIFQFAIVVFLLFSLLTVRYQLEFLKKKPLGLNLHNVVSFTNFNRDIYLHSQSIESQLLEIPEVEDVAFSLHTIGSGPSGQGIKLYGASDDAGKSIDEYRVYPGFCKLYKFELQWGRFFRPDELGKDDVIILNESAADMLGIDEHSEKIVDMFDFPMRVIGVVSDFMHQGAKSKVNPMELSCRGLRFWNINIRLNSNLSENTRKKIVNIIKEHDPDYVPKYQFINDIINGFYDNESQVMRIVGFGSIVAILISLMGLLALTIYQLKKRMKELAIRRIMGASSINILVSLIKKLLKQLIWASLLATPIALWVMSYWLNGYPYHIQISYLILLLSIILPVLLTLITVGWLLLRVANKNPIENVTYK